MDDYVIIYDTTLRDGEQAPGFRMNSSEKFEVALALEELGVDIIEAGFPGSSKGDFDSVNNIAKGIKNPVISALARCKEKDIRAAGEAIKPAIERGKGKIHVFIATSDIHIQNKLKKTKEEVIGMAVDGVKLARSYTPYVEFSPEDFTRSDLDYVVEIVNAVIDAGATTINLPDTVGVSTPEEIIEKVKYVIEHVNNPDVIYSIHPHNDLGLATANSLSALMGGCRQVECTINGIGERAGNASLEEVVAIITERSDFYKLKTKINTEKIVGVSKLVSKITGRETPWNKAIVGQNASRHSAGIHTDGILKDSKTYEWIDPRKYGGKSEMPLTARSGSHQVIEGLNQKQIKYNPDEIDEIMQRFKQVADDTTGEVYDDSLVMAVRGDEKIPNYYELLEFNPSLDKSGAWIKMVIKVNGNSKTVFAEGNGMIDATTNAIGKFMDFPLRVEDYLSKAIGTGSDAKGEESVILRNNGYRVRGVGIDCDTVRGAAKALIDASNRMRYILENQKKS